MINYLTNYFHNGTPRNFKIAIPTKYHEATEGLEHHEDNVQDASKSQTRACTIYDFRKQDTIFNYIDTPGLSDTEGVAQDDFNIQQIMGAAEQSGVLTAIILVINGTQARATVNLRNTLCLLRSSIPDVLLQNLVVVLTNCSATSVNFDLAHLKPWTIPEANIFHMNNSALSRPVSQWINNERMKKDLEREWEYSMETIDELIQSLKLFGGKATEAFKQMRINRDRIKSQLHSILLDVKKFQGLQNELGLCKCKHSHFRHYDDNVRPVKKTKTVEEILEDVKNAYDHHMNKCEKIESEIGDLDADVAALKHALDEKEVEIRKHCNQLKELCSQFNFVDELQGVIAVMDRDARTLTSTEARADAEKRIGNIKHVVDTLSSSGMSG
ncbi:uncharacterized protein LOC109414088 isoform X2 [Aedes albopictus]|uniref:AIG1-type G domain-containing protein n=1 Tax=Aedes albopictus TaxID=7160 RepID=A0ABM1YRM7_AEDAL|nr:uncharacterized protein LOC109414088 isoform X2 [Aedes albopictus]